MHVLVPAVALTTFLSACTDRASSPENLQLLLDEGVNEKALARSEARFAKAEQRGKDSEARIATYGALNDGEDVTEAGTLLQAALEQNTRIGAAAQQISEADANRLNAIFGYLPQISFSYSQDQVNQTVVESDNAVFELGEADYPVTVFTVTMEQPIFDLSRIFAISYASNARTKAEVDYITTVRDVAYEVLDTYVVAVQSQTRAKYLRQRIQLLNRQIGSQSALTETGLADEIEASSLRAERGSIASEEALETARYAETLANLAELTGTVVNEPAPLSLPRNLLGSEKKMDLEELVARGLRENPAMMSASLAVVGADLERKQAIASDFAPVIEAYALLENEDRGGSRFGGASVTEDTTIGVQLTLPIFNARGSGYDTLPSGPRLRQNVMEYHTQKRQLETQIRATFERLSQLSTAASQSAGAVTQANRALRTEQARLETGQSVDLAVAARALRLSQARERVAFYQAEYLRSSLRLEYLTGADMQRPNF